MLRAPTHVTHQMKQDTHTNHFQIWPFRSEAYRSDGEVNNGGIDLVGSPEKIDIIHEATDTIGLRPLIIYLNRPQGCFMTLGCAAGLDDDGIYYSYLEFTTRRLDLSARKGWPQLFEKKWQRFLVRANSQFPGVAPWLEGRTAMVYRSFSFRKTAPCILIEASFRASSEVEHQKIVSYTQRFFELLESGALN